MKEKILNVKNILKIIIILFILFNMAKSCSYAFTREEFEDYIQSSLRNNESWTQNNVYGNCYMMTRINTWIQSYNGWENLWNAYETQFTNAKSMACSCSAEFTSSGTSTITWWLNTSLTTATQASNGGWTTPATYYITWTKASNGNVTHTRGTKSTKHG